MHFLYPCLPYQPRTVDPLWAPEYEWVRAHGVATGLVDLDNDKVWWGPTALSAAPLAKVLYRGWMLTAADYDRLAQLVPLAIAPAAYLSSHHATGWYEAIATHTFPSRFLTEPTEQDFTNQRRYFVKGLVKSFDAGSVLTTQNQLVYFWEEQELPVGTPLFCTGFCGVKAGFRTPLLCGTWAGVWCQWSGAAAVAKGSIGGASASPLLFVRCSRNASWRTRVIRSRRWPGIGPKRMDGGRVW